MDLTGRAYLAQKKLKYARNYAGMMPKVIEKARDGDKAEKPKVCLISFPMPSTIVVTASLFSLIDILKPIAKFVYVITGNVPDRSEPNVKIIDIKTAMHIRDSIRSLWWSTLLQLFKVVAIQLKMGWSLARISGDTDIVIFHQGGANLFPLIFLAKVLKKKVVVRAAGSTIRPIKKDLTEELNVSKLLSPLLNILTRANFHLADLIVTESPCATDFLGLNRYGEKVTPTGARFVDFELFQIKQLLKERRKIGYIGRIAEGKGLVNLVKAIPLISAKYKNIEFLIGGQGSAYQKIKAGLGNDLSGKIELTGWIPHDEIADYLNELKLLILPSYSEGLPTVVLEAMACGTPVLATPVGGIPDVIRDGETGFIMEDNSPESIAKNVIRALEQPNLEQIAENAYNLVKKQYNYESTVERYRSILRRAWHSSKENGISNHL